MLYSLLNNEQKGLYMSAYNVPSAPIILPNDDGRLITHVYTMKDVSIANAQEAAEELIGNIEHVGCNRTMSARKVSPRKTILFCQECGLRIELPSTVTTFGELKLFFRNKK